LGVFAHPDDESMGPGATFAKYAAAGHRVAFVTATDGGAGRLGPERPETEEGRATLRATRRAETVAAARILGADFLGFLDYDDGTLAARNVLEIEETIVSILRRERPDVVVTFHGSGISYHPDHRVITLATMGAVLGSGRELWYRTEALQNLRPHTVSKLYTFVPSSEAAYWRDWPREIYAAAAAEITTVVDTKATAAVKWAAIEAHASQQYGPPFRKLWEAGAFAEEYFVRVFPGADPSTPPETDLFEGLD
jgi:N-acetyl-1-D-myo-inositol-2-amino-2-deoxy-alpha-D-glucopyranoside deacetylase/mycothiol S-conjugate amidase